MKFLPWWRSIWIASSLCFSAGPALAADDVAALWAALAQGGRVALVRHAEAPGGAGDPPGFRLDDCATQRNLSREGRAQARALGERFRAARVSVGRILHSRWCRARDTANLMKLGPVAPASVFDYAYATFNRSRAGELTDGAHRVIDAWTGPGTLVVVTHGSNIRLLTGIDPGEAGIAVVERDPARPGELRLLGRIPPGR